MPSRSRRVVAIQRNPLSGTGLYRHELLNLAAGLRRFGFQPRIFSRRERLRAWLELPENRGRLACLVAAGGDGTVGDMLNRYPGLPLAILPLGTENLLARYLHIPCCGQDVADMIAAGLRRRLDVCRVGERRFAIMASFGLDADVVHRTHARRTGNITRLSYLQPIWDSLTQYEFPELRLYVDDRPTPLRARLAILMNLPAYALGLGIAPNACCDDGLFDLRLFDHASSIQMMRDLFDVVRGGLGHPEHVRTVRAAKVRIEADVPVPVQMDGDPAGWTPTEVSVLPAALEVIVPAGQGCSQWLVVRE